MAKLKKEEGCAMVFAIVMCIYLIIGAISWVVTNGIPSTINGIGKGIENVEDKVGPTMRKLNNRRTIEDLESDYYFGNKTPSGWGAGEWYKYKTETPHKARQYLNSLATD